MTVTPIQACQDTGRVSNPQFDQSDKGLANSIIKLQDLYFLFCMLEIAQEATGTPDQENTITYYGVKLSKKEYPRAFNAYIRIHNKDDERTATIKIKETIVVLYKKLSRKAQKALGFNPRKPDFNLLNSAELEHYSTKDKNDASIIRDLIKLVTMLEIAKDATGGKDIEDTMTYFGYKLSGLEAEIDGTFDRYMEVHGQKPDRTATRKTKMTILAVWDSLPQEIKDKFGPINDPIAEINKGLIQGVLSKLCAPPQKVHMARAAVRPEPTLTMIPLSLRVGEEKNVHILGENIDTSDIYAENLSVDIIANDHTSVLVDGAITLNDNQASITLDSSAGTINIGVLADTDSKKNQQVKVKVQADTTPGTYLLVLKHEDDVVATQEITVQESEREISDSRSKKFWSWTKKYLDPRFRAGTGHTFLDVNSSNPNVQSVVQDRAVNNYDLDVTLRPNYTFTPGATEIALEAPLRGRYSQTRSNLEAAFNANVRAGIFKGGVFVGVEHEMYDLDTPSLTIPWEKRTTLPVGAQAGVALDNIGLSAVARYTYMPLWFAYQQAVLGENFEGKGSTHRIEAEVALDRTKVKAKVSGGYETGKVDTADTIDDEGKDVYNWFVRGGVQIPFLMDLYAKASYSRGKNRGTETLQDFQAALGFNPGGFRYFPQNFVELQYQNADVSPVVPVKIQNLGAAWRNRFFEVGLGWQRIQENDGGYLEGWLNVDQLIPGLRREEEDPLRWE